MTSARGRSLSFWNQSRARSTRFGIRPDPLLEAQLRLEVGEGHPLFGKSVIAIARCGRCDEVLFRVEGNSAGFVQVQLTWRQGLETPPWPATEELSVPLADSLIEHH